MDSDPIGDGYSNEDDEVFEGKQRLIQEKNEQISSSRRASQRTLVTDKAPVLSPPPVSQETERKNSKTFAKTLSMIEANTMMEPRGSVTLNDPPIKVVEPDNALDVQQNEVEVESNNSNPNKRRKLSRDVKLDSSSEQIVEDQKPESITENVEPLKPPLLGDPRRASVSVDNSELMLLSESMDTVPEMDRTVGTHRSMRQLKRSKTKWMAAAVSAIGQ